MEPNSKESAPNFDSHPFASIGSRARLEELLVAVMDTNRDLELPAVLKRTVKAACSLVDAQYGALGVIGDDGNLVQFHVHGMTDEQINAIGDLPRGRGILGHLIDESEPLRLTDLRVHPASHGFPANHPPMRTFLGVPITISGKAFGNLYLTEKADGAEFSEDDETLIIALATVTAAIIDNARLYSMLSESQSERERLAIYRDRDRIARDLHDLVIQRLFATGLQLQNVLHLTDSLEIGERINTAVDELDSSIADLRAAIFSLHSVDETELTGLVRGLVGVARHHLGFLPEVTFSGPVNSVQPERVRTETLAVVREALSNVARHAQAQRASVTVAVKENRLSVDVMDDGRGIADGSPRRGLANLATRASELGGWFSIEAAEPKGTVLCWTVPL